MKPTIKLATYREQESRMTPLARKVMRNALRRSGNRKSGTRKGEAERMGWRVKQSC